MLSPREPTGRGRLARRLAAAVLALALGGCDLIKPDPAEEVIVQSLETTYSTGVVPIDSMAYPPDAPPGEVLVDSLLYRAAVEVADTMLGSEPMSLDVRVWIRNPFNHPVTIPVRYCPEWPRAYASIDRSDPPLWDPPRNDLGYDCPPGAVDVTVDPGEEISGAVSVRTVHLSRALPDGRYYFSLEFWTPDEVLEFPAGSADIRFREPGLQFEATLDNAGDETQVDVGVTNLNGVPMRLEWGHCALTLGLYHDAGRSDLVRRWSTSFGNTCLGYLTGATVGTGGTVWPSEFSRPFNGADVLDLPAGTYFLAVRVELNQRVYEIPAGEVVLR